MKAQDYAGVGKACQRCFKRKATKQVLNQKEFKVYCSVCLKMIARDASHRDPTDKEPTA